MNNLIDAIPDLNQAGLADQIELLGLYDDIDSILDKLRFSNSRAKQIFIEYIYDLIYIENPSDRNTQQHYADKYECSQAQVARVIKHGINLLKEELGKYSYTL